MERTVLANIDSDYLIGLTRRLVQIPTPNPPADYAVIADTIRRLMAEQGLEVEVLAKETGKTNVVGLWRGSDPQAPTLLLDAHMDVVPAGEGWNVDPWAAEIRNGDIWGRGAADMKQSLAIMIAVIKALKKAGFTPRGNLLVSATVDDETAGKLGLKYVVEEGLAKIGYPSPNFHLLLEPSRWGLNVAFKGRVWIKITLAGKSAHGGFPEKGINAVHKMFDLYRELYAMPRERHPLMGEDTLTIGTIAGGEKTNVVPDACTATFDYRFVGPYTAADAVNRFTAVIKRLEQNDAAFKVAEFTVFENRNPVEVKTDEPALALLRRCVEDVTGRPAKYTGTLSAGNAYWSLSRGIAAVMAGPGNVDIIHTNQEHIAISEIIEGAKIVAAYVVRYLS